MNLNKFIQTLRSFMARRSSRRAKQAVLKDLRVQLIPVQKESFDGVTHREVVEHLISMMVQNLRKRGRPAKSEEGELAYAI